MPLQLPAAVSVASAGRRGAAAGSGVQNDGDGGGDDSSHLSPRSKHRSAPGVHPREIQPGPAATGPAVGAPLPGSAAAVAMAHRSPRLTAVGIAVDLAQQQKQQQRAPDLFHLAAEPPGAIAGEEG